jgi:glutamate/tyrosine decarboxylase-like PLP-dependent enzyme
MNHLFPDGDERVSIDNMVTLLLAQITRHVDYGSVVPTFNLAKFRDELATFDFAGPMSFQEYNELIVWTIRQMEHGIVHITHPRYFGLFNPKPTFPAEIADRITAAFNPQLATWTTSPAAVEIESHVIRAVSARIGLPPGSTGHFTAGGSEANFTAVLLALIKFCPRFVEEGARAFPGQPVFYVSKESHLAWLKIAQQAGIGRTAVRLVDTDGHGRMKADALRWALQCDLEEGRTPFMIAATAGTTGAGMIDPLSECAQIAYNFGLWYHVDAAWGGGLIASDTLHHRLVGLERADSVTIDAHKWFATTMGCGMFVTQHPELLATSFYVLTGYMPSHEVSVDPYVTSIQWSRRFLGLRLFLSLAATGWEGYAGHVEHALTMIGLLEKQLIEHGWIIVNESPVGVLCFIPPSGSVRQIVKQVVTSGTAWVSVAVTEGREVIRACVTCGTTTEEDISELVNTLMRAEQTTHGDQ